MTTADGRKMKSLFTLDNDGKLVQVANYGVDNKQIVIVVLARTTD
jgi:hypothetical protein